ncbi:MAG TPA: acyloxyacyl hydrolase [Opitutaceae bacterium]|nr:acyloxyacyl hydrolase [Opitutaceae bacterium]
MSRLVLVSAFALFAAASSPAAPARDERDDALRQGEPAQVAVGYAMAGVADAKQLHCGFLEWRGRPFWHGLAPYVFGSWRRTGANYLGVGLVYGINLAPRWRLSVSSGPGYFEHDGDLDLGSRLEFASALEVAYRISGGRRLACGIGHVSNAGAGRINPGSEFIRLSLQLPLWPRSANRRAPASPRRRAHACRQRRTFASFPGWNSAISATSRVSRSV